MLRARRFVRFAFVAALLAGGALASNACSNQGEGERCDHLAQNGGNDDCQDGLQCTSGSVLNGSPTGDRCCPVDRSQATTSVCALNSNGVAPPPTFDAGTADAPTDDGAASQDAAGDGSADAAAE